MLLTTIPSGLPHRRGTVPGTIPNDLPHRRRTAPSTHRSTMNVAKCLTLLNWIKFPWLHFPLDCGLSLSSSSCLCHQTTWHPPHLGVGGGALNSCWPRMCFPSTSVNWEEPMGCKSWIWDSPKVFVCTNPDNSWDSSLGRRSLVGEVNVWVCPSSLHRGVQGPRLQVSCLEHIVHPLWISGGKTTHLTTALWLDIWEKDSGDPDPLNFYSCSREHFSPQVICCSFTKQLICAKCCIEHVMCII